jgi:2-oxoglutarate/2-oxoacid ferredoxin oxidoreductase subunit alpha
VTTNLLTGEHFMAGNTAAAEGALAAGCLFYAGYPITPSTELAERMSRRLPKLGGIFVQMEDEIASVAAILGASWAGKKSMTATSGPGLSLMMENIGLGVITETPCVIVDVQRGGPSTGLPTLVGQQDVMQARWGSHGDYEVIAISPSSVQECFDLTLQSFNLSEEYRVPTLVMMDECVSHMWETLVIPPREKLAIHDRRIYDGPKDSYLPYKAGSDMVPPMIKAGEGYNVHVTGLTHDEKGYPVINAQAQEKLVRRLCDKIRLNADKIIRTEEFMTQDADVIVVSFGSVARSTKRAVKMARSKGIKAGMLRLITIWPFAEKKIDELSRRTKAFVVAEINYGQMLYEVERCARGRSKVVPCGKLGGELHHPEEILKVIEEVSR